MSTYKIVGPLPVAGCEPGAVLNEDDLAGLDIPYLIGAGHLIPTKASKADTVTPQED